jgi:hypothetical protein
MKTYRIEYQANGEWMPGNIVMMKPCHLDRYLEFLNGDRPIVSFAEGTFKKVMERRKAKCLPTRVRAVDPDWTEEDGYYLFDGATIQFVDLSELDGFRVRLSKNRPA